MHFDYEDVQFESKCEKCKMISKHKKKIFLTRFPKILILSLQRINLYKQTKNECIVDFPEILDINDYIDEDFKTNINTIYNLFGIINHIGAVNFGYYYSFIKFYNKIDWYEFNDSDVKYIGNKILDIKNAYILIYIQS